MEFLKYLALELKGRGRAEGRQGKREGTCQEENIIRGAVGGRDKNEAGKPRRQKETKSGDGAGQL